MNAQKTSGGMSMHSTTLLAMAYKSAVRARQAAAVEELTRDSLSAIILASSAAEGLLNDTVAIVLTIAAHGALGTPPSAASARLVGIAEALDCVGIAQSNRITHLDIFTPNKCSTHLTCTSLK
jgi:hypothetical protein